MASIDTFREEPVRIYSVGVMAVQPNNGMPAVNYYQIAACSAGRACRAAEEVSRVSNPGAPLHIASMVSQLTTTALTGDGLQTVAELA